VFTSREHPLVLFLDDLQWADTASLQLIEHLLTNTQVSHLLFIGAYRDNEVTSQHPFYSTREALEKTQASISTITVTPLKEQELQHMLSDMLRNDLDTVAPLARLCREKTAGNPFFVQQFLRTLYEEEKLQLERDTKRWSWDIKALQKMEVTDNVIGLMVHKIKKLVPAAQKLLQTAAVIGHRFRLDQLAMLVAETTKKTAEDLWQALQEGLILPLSGAYQYTGERQASQVMYQFLHDRVQQAAYSMLSQKQAIDTHKKIGQLLLESTASKETHEQVFDIVYHLNKGNLGEEDTSAREKLAQLNLLAGKRAKTSAAYKASSEFLQQGISCLSKKPWKEQYQLTLQLHEEAAEVAFLSGQFEKMNVFCQRTISQATSILDKIKCYDIQLQAHIAQQQISKALRLSQSVLLKLGIQLPGRPNHIQIVLNTVRIKHELRNTTTKDLLALPKMTDPLQLAASQILARTVSAIYRTSVNHMPIIVFTLVRLSLRYGNSPYSAFAYAAMGMFLSGAIHELKEGAEMTELGCELTEQDDPRNMGARTSLLYLFCSHWTQPIRLLEHKYLTAYQKALEAGDFEYATLTLNSQAMYYLLAGYPLEQLEEDCAKYAQQCIEFKQEPSLHTQRLVQQVVHNLSYPGSLNGMLQGKFFQESRRLTFHQDPRDGTASFFYHFFKVLLCYNAEEYQQAFVHCLEANKFIRSVTGMMVSPFFNFYDSLTRLAIYPYQSAFTKLKFRFKIFLNQKNMKHWAKHAPENYLNKYQLVEAERARVLGKDVQAIQWYEKAIETAKNHEFLHEEALANELAARCYESWGHRRMAHSLQKDAWHCYTHWGSQAKVFMLEAKYPHLRDVLYSPGNETTQSGTRESTQHSTARSSGEHLDLASVLKASQAISGELALQQLLSTLLHIALENAGAERGLLCLQEQDKWFVQASGNQEGAIKVLQAEPLSETKGCSQSIIRYVQRKKEPVVLPDAMTSEFSKEPYIQEYNPRSILCMPLLAQGNLKGILYLENNLVTGAFTPDRLETLKLLSSQAAISIEKAQLFQELQEAHTALTDHNENLEQKVTERTQELSKALEQLETQHVKLQDTQGQLVQSEKMASLGVLVAGVAHELNNPVNFTYNGAYNVEKDVKKLGALLKELTEDDEEFWDMLFEHLDPITKGLEGVLEGSKRIKGIVTGLRTFSRLDEAEQKEASAIEGLRNTLLLIEGNYKKQVEFVTDLKDDPVFECWPGQLNQVFMNVVVNACQAIVAKQREDGTHTKGTLTIRSKIEEPWLKLTFEDTGIGMPRDIKEKVFEPFFTTKDVGQGTGLGMSISYGIIEKHGGSIQIESTQGKGSTVTILLDHHRRRPRSGTYAQVDSE